jgi:peptidoglycan/xylan/chitin deacetylase (PgdA/CDA1 family)
LTFPLSATSIDLPILMYHHLEWRQTSSEYTISAQQFARHLHRLSNDGFTTISFRQLVEALDRPGSLPPRPVIISFDDGYESFRQMALPALVAHGMSASVFVVAGEIGGTDRWDRERARAPRQLMDESGIAEVIAAGMEIGSHGWAHRDLTTSSAGEMDEELVRSREHLVDRFGVEVGVFAYPYGRYEPRHFERLAHAGYGAAATIFSTAPTVTYERFAMRRVYIHPGDAGLRFRSKLTPAYLRYMAWRDGRPAQCVEAR